MQEYFQYMQRCLELAQQGLGLVAPNPMVGCVIVHNEKIIGEGYHHEYGGPHAEVNAINSVKDKELLKDSTLYVNLEPCSHHGKTPPCSDLIIEKQIPRVVIGCQDSFSEVSGRGIKKLRNAGIDVTVGILEKESREINKRFFTFHEKKRPYIILKWAQTIDGFIDIERKGTEKPHINWITGKELKILVHKWRTEEAGIIVGTATAINDNPQLNARLWSGKNPVRMVINENLTLPHKINLFDGSQRTLVFTAKDEKPISHCEYFNLDFKQPVLPQIMEILHNLSIQSIIVEGGKELLESFINNNLWDEARILIGNKVFEKGLKAPPFPESEFESQIIGEDRLIFIKNKSSD